MTARTGKTDKPSRRMRGFERTSGLLTDKIRKASEKRGFAETRVLTHWPEVVGAEIAAVARPISVSYSRGGFGATLTVLTTGAQAPMLEMQKDRLREQVNAAYGYNAISRVRITQTAPTGFSDGQARFEAPAPVQPAEPSPEICRDATQTAGDVADDGLRAALERLGRNVLSKQRN